MILGIDMIIANKCAKILLYNNLLLIYIIYIIILYVYQNRYYVNMYNINVYIFEAPSKSKYFTLIVNY